MSVDTSMFEPLHRKYKDKLSDQTSTFINSDLEGKRFSRFERVTNKWGSRFLLNGWSQDIYKVPNLLLHPKPRVFPVGEILYRIHFKNGTIHREDGPAIIASEIKREDHLFSYEWKVWILNGKTKKMQEGYKEN